MKTTAIAASVLALAVATSLATAQTAFTQYKSPDGAFTVMFPGTPEIDPPQTQSRPDGTSYTESRYSVQDDAGYLIDVADYPNTNEMPDAESGSSAEAKGCGGTYTIRNRDNFQGHTAALIQVNCPASDTQGALVILEQFIVNGNRVYMVAYGAATLNAERSSQFLNSFHIN